MAFATNPYYDAQEVTEDDLNTNLYRMFPVVADSVAEMNRALAAHTVGAQSFPAVPIGTIGYRSDQQAIYFVNTSRQWELVANLKDLQALGRPYLPIYDSAGTYVGRVTMSASGTATQFLVANAADTDIFRVDYDTAATGVKTEMRAVDASGLRLTSLNRSYNLTLTDTETMVQSGAGLRLKAQTLLMEDVAGSAGPLLSIGGASAGVMKALGTDASGAVEAYDRPVSYPSFMPTAIPGTAMAGDGIRLNAARTAMEFGPVAAAGGGGSPAESFFTPSLPAATRSAVAETQINIAAGTLSADHPFSVVSNGIVVAAGTSPFAATLDYVLNLNASAWTNSRTASGNRLFVEVYWKKDGTIMDDTRTSHYIRGDEDWSSGDHYLHGNYSEILEPATYTLWINRRVAAAAGNEISGYEIVAANSDIHIVTAGAGGGAAATTFLALTDTPSTYTSGQYLRMTATGIEGVAAPSGGATLGPNSINPPMLNANTLAERQAFLDRLQIPIHETLTSNSFVITAGVRSGFVGFITSPATGSINGRSTPFNVSIGGTTYQISALYQVTVAGGTQNNIVLRISPDPANDISAEWSLQIGPSLTFLFADATAATDAGGRVSYSWTGNTAGIFVGGQAYNCALRIPFVEQFVTAPIQMGSIQGTLDPTQYRDNSIAYTRAIGATPSDQAGWRTKLGFAAFTSNALSVLKFRNGQVIQEPLDITSLNNFGPTAEPSAGATPVLMKWGPTGLQPIQRLDMADLPRPAGLTQGDVVKWDGTAWTAAAESGGTGTAFSWATAGRMPNLSTLPGFTAGQRKVIVGTGTNNVYEFRQLAFGDISGTLAAGAFPAGIITGTMMAGDTITPDKANIAGGNLTAWQTRLGIPASSTASVATWARAGNTDIIPDAKIDPFVYHDLSRLESMTLTVGHYSGARGFDRVTGGGGSLTNATFNLGSGNLTVIAIDQLPSTSVGGTSEIEFSIVGAIPTNWNDYYLVFERDDFAKALKFSDATMRTPPVDTNYPAGLQNYTRYTWAAQPDNILYRQAANSTTRVYIAAPFYLAVGHYLLLPNNPTTSEYKFLVANNGGARYRSADLSAHDQAHFNLAAAAVNRTNQNAGDAVLTGSGVAAFFTRSGNVLTARKQGLAHVALTLRPGASNEGLLVIYARINGTDLARSEATIRDYRDVVPVSFTYPFNVGDTLSFRYQALDVPVAASVSSLPASPTFATPAYSAADNETTVTITAPGTATYDYVEYSRRIHGAGTADWEPWTRILGDSTTIYIPDVNKERTDIRVRLVNAAGVGRYRQFIAGQTTTAEEAAAGFGQTADFTGDIHISRPSLQVL